MQVFNPHDLKKLYVPLPDSHKGQNGKLMLIGGSHLFHAASLWSLTAASRIVDMVFYSSIPENNEIVHELKKEFRNGIIVEREHLEDYIDEADCIVIGPGMMRTEKDHDDMEIGNIQEINQFSDEGLQSYYLTRYLLTNYPHKKWVIDAGALQMLDPLWLGPLHGNVILTPHIGEFERLAAKIKNKELKARIDKEDLQGKIKIFAEEFKCIVLLKGPEDVVCSHEKCTRVSGGNAGMTKGGTGDVLTGLVGALACKNDLFLAATAGSYINKKAGESLAKHVGLNFNSSDLAAEIPKVMGELIK